MLQAPETMQALTSAPWGFTSGDTSQKLPAGSQSSFVSPPKDLRLSMALEDSLRISVSALVFAAFCGLGILMPFCQPQKLRIRGMAWRWLGIYANGLVCLASLLVLVALLLWIYDQGLSAALILPIILLVYVLMVTLLLVVTLIFQLDILHQVTDKAGQRLLNFTTPGGMILIVVTSSLLIKQIYLLQEKGTAEPVDLTAVIAGTSGISLLPLVVIKVFYCMDLRKQEVEEQISRREKGKENI
ncbi:uncharacterized protein LOC129341757 [Eublepharis macularius]|uniref:Uncharacterized protein LOC129341757 n=1 Tax=Eublepharis macularius TaxID=481883 RepID=A0AA97KBE5_EUBMA|nr:uncharacterized protein LOC129341757 [Eublepharis macularius]